MSSFASRAREEIAQRSIQKDCCVRAAAYGIACFAKYFDAKGLVVQTEQQETVQAAQQLFARCGVQGEILHKQRPSGVLYEFNIRAPEQVARVHELFGTTGSETSLQIDPRLIRCQTCVSAYIGAAFLCSGTVIDPQKEYNLEFLTSRTNLARDFEALLAEHEFAPHRTRRNGGSTSRPGPMWNGCSALWALETLQRKCMHKKPSNRCATRPTDRPTATPQTSAKRPAPMRRR